MCRSYQKPAERMKTLLTFKNAYAIMNVYIHSRAEIRLRIYKIYQKRGIKR